ncbi:MAG TPA: response regulator [Vicinamibacterales bacterium]|jgi:CheY-like chemotaxis protein
MNQRPYHVLVAEDHPLTRHEIVSVLQQRDYSVLSVDTPIEVAQTLKRWPVDLLITGTRMGSWYGLQVILTGRASQPDLAAIIVSDGEGQADQLDAGRHRVTIARRPIASQEFLALVAERLASIQRRQRWPRKAVTSEVEVSMSGRCGRLIDVSYGGCRVQLEGGPVLASSMRMSLAAPRIDLNAALIWSAISADGSSCVAGVSVDQDRDPIGPWRRFVDHVN